MIKLTGRLQRFDPLTNSDRTIQEGEVFDYQELLDGNIAFISSAEEAQILFQVFINLLTLEEETPTARYFILRLMMVIPITKM